MREITTKEARAILKENGFNNKQVGVTTMRGSYTSMIVLKIKTNGICSKIMNIFDDCDVVYNTVDCDC